MEDNKLAANAPAADTNGVPATNQASSDSNKTVSLSVEEFTKLLDARDQKLKDSFEAKLRKSSEQKPIEKKSTEDEVAAIRAEVEKDRNENAMEKREIAISKGLRDANIMPEMEEAAYAYVLHKFGDKIKVEGKKVYALGELDKEISVSEFLTQKLAGKVGDAFRAPQQVPQGRGLKPSASSGNKRLVTQADLKEGRVSSKDILNGSVEVVA